MLVTAPAAAQFLITNVSVQRQPLHFNSTKYTVFSGATYFAHALYNRDATHGNSIYVGSIFNSPWGHIIQGPFTNGEFFACALNPRGVFNPFPCSAVS